MSKIMISRNREWSNRMRQFAIQLDGQKLGGVANGDAETFEVPPGTHTLKATIDWCSSPEQPFTIAAGETKYFKVSGFKYGNIVAPLTLLIVAAHYLLKKLAGFPHLIWLAIPGFLLLLYYLTIGRKAYLQLQPADSW